MKSNLPKQRVRSKPGDILEAKLPNGRYAYLRYLGRLELGLDVVEVLQDDGDRVRSLDEIAKMQRQYVLCTFVRYLRISSAITFIGNRPSSDAMPRFRQSALNGWRLPDGSIVSSLDKTSAQLPILEGLSADVVLNRLAKRWRPELDRVDAVSRLRLSTQHFTAARIVFLKFPTVANARKGAALLTASGFQTSISGRRVQVRHSETQRETEYESLESLENAVLSVAQGLGAECEGNEVELG
jgi:hypothetical protein